MYCDKIRGQFPEPPPILYAALKSCPCIWSSAHLAYVLYKAVPAERLVGPCCSGCSALPSLVKERRPQGHPGRRGWQHVGPPGPGGGVGGWSPGCRAVSEINNMSENGQPK